MKKHILSLCICLSFAMMSFSQTVNNVPIKDIDVEYIEIAGRGKPLSSKVNVEIDFGQESSIFGSVKHTVIKDSVGMKMEFNSMVLALNFMSKYGYEFVQAYTTHDENSNTVYYLMKKKAQEEK